MIRISFDVKKVKAIYKEPTYRKKLEKYSEAYDKDGKKIPAYYYKDVFQAGGGWRVSFMGTEMTLLEFQQKFNKFKTGNPVIKNGFCSLEGGSKTNWIYFGGSVKDFEHVQDFFEEIADFLKDAFEVDFVDLPF